MDGLAIILGRCVYMFSLLFVLCMTSLYWSYTIHYGCIFIISILYTMVLELIKLLTTGLNIYFVKLT